MAQIQIVGRVLDAANDQPLAQARIEVRAQGLNQPNPFGAANTDRSGEFKIRLNQADLIEAYRNRDIARVLEFKVFLDGEPLTIQSGATQPLEARPRRVTVVVERTNQPEPEPPPGDGHFGVRGQVVDAKTGAAVPGLVVRAFDQDMPSTHREERLGPDVTTDGQGRYLARYDFKDFQ